MIAASFNSGEWIFYAIAALDVVLGLLLFNAIRKQQSGQLLKHSLAIAFLAAFPFCAGRLLQMIQPVDGDLAWVSKIFVDIFLYMSGLFIAGGYIALVLANWLLSKRNNAKVQ